MCRKWLDWVDDVVADQGESCIKGKYVYVLIRIRIKVKDIEFHRLPATGSKATIGNAS